MTTIPPDGLTIKYENHSPIELADLTTSLQAVARRYARFAAQSGVTFEDENASALYVREIRPGSVIVDLINWGLDHKGTLTAAAGGVVGVGTAATQVNALTTFAKNLRDSLNWLKGSGDKPDDVSTSELKDISKILEPIAKDPGANLHINASEGAHVIVSVNYNSLEANAIQNRADKIIEERAEPAQKSFRRVLMYWWQANKGAESTSDKVVIDDISEKPLKVVFEDDEIKSKMLSGAGNPFNESFLVDVHLLTVRGRPKAYKVTKLHEVMDSDETGED